MAAMLLFQTSPMGVELFSYINALFCYNKFAQILATLVKTLYKYINGFKVVLSVYSLWLHSLSLINVM